MTMHWYGLSQSVALYSDGTPQASQWPVKAQHYFDYELRPDIGEAGTYFYHSHVGFQAGSVTGPLIVEQQTGAPPYQYDDERTIVLTELFNYTDKIVVQGITAPLANFPWPGEAASILVNGENYPSLLANETHPFHDPADQQSSPSGSQTRPDSHYTEPASTNMIQIGSGQRSDFLLRTKPTDELRRAGRSQFWIQFETRFRQQWNTFYALLVYEGLGNRSTSNSKLDRNDKVPSHPSAQKAVVLPIHSQSWMEYTLQPLTDNNFPPAEQVTRQIVLRIRYASVAYSRRSRP
ncbi:hypothetical protein N8T08_000612 [Aspergillus melleus]|uniref:Uncharacterized protein n=1 Tax=Aspergillus melleus TaxID=138277 RepID=A0ACC3APL1_9EURO|nr:hypothetical protein N8T08_000612 [Aspergillus melleus]